MQSLQLILMEIEQLSSDQTLGLPANVTASYNRAKQLMSEAESNFNESWYSAAVAELSDAVSSRSRSRSRVGNSCANLADESNDCRNHDNRIASAHNS